MSRFYFIIKTECCIYKREPLLSCQNIKPYILYQNHLQL